MNNPVFGNFQVQITTGVGPLTIWLKKFRAKKGISRTARLHKQHLGEISEFCKYFMLLFCKQLSKTIQQVRNGRCMIKP